MKISVLKERRPGETRVAATPETVKKLVGLGHSVTVEQGAGTVAGFLDAAFTEAGATLAGTPAEAAKGADIVFKVRRPEPGEIAALPDGSALIALMEPFAYPAEELAALNAKKIAALSMEFTPRITRPAKRPHKSGASMCTGKVSLILATGAFHVGPHRAAPVIADTSRAKPVSDKQSALFGVSLMM
jgi:NAD(P) transhydrogenase subunit alpha